MDKRAPIISRKSLVNKQPTGQLALLRSKQPLTVKPATVTSSETQTIEKLPVLATPDQPLQFHPIAEIFPMLSADRLQELADDIKARGLQQPIVLFEDKILDGRNRYRACKAAGADISCEEYKGDDPVGFVLSRNVYRRHLIERQRAMVAARLSNLKVGANQHNEGVSIGRASELLSVSRRSVARAKRVLEDGVPELIEAVDRGTIALDAAVKISRLPPEEQRRILTHNQDTGAKAAARKVATKKRGVVAPDTDAMTAENEGLRAELVATYERLRKAEQQLTARGAVPPAGANGTAAHGANLELHLTGEDEKILTAMMKMIAPVMERASHSLRRRVIAELQNRFGIEA